MLKKKVFYPQTRIKIFAASTIFLVFASLGCSNQNKVDKTYYAPGKVYETDKEVLIPVQLLQMIKDKYVQNYKLTSEIEGITDKEILKKIARRYLNISVYIESETPNVIYENMKFDLPSGGGYIDFSEVVREGKRGNFKLRFEVQDSNKPPSIVNDKVHVFFVSNAKRNKIDNDFFGSGCDIFNDVTNYFRTTIIGPGLKVNTTDQRYLSVLGGTFFFVLPSFENLYLGSLSFKDSRHSDLLCRN